MSSKKSLPEHLLHRIWRDHPRYLQSPLVAVDGQPVEILDAGEYNAHRGGPDFLQAKIAVDGVAVGGDIEIHREHQDWDKHGHDRDMRYNQVVLHVLLDYSGEAAHSLPTVLIRENLRLERSDLWEELFASLYDRSPELKCFPHNLLLTNHFKTKVVEHFGEARLDELIGRLKPETESFTEAEHLQTVYERVLDALGYSENRKPFTELARLLPIALLRAVRKYAPVGKESITFEALYLGAAGLLKEASPEFDVEVNDRIVELRSRWEAIQPVVTLFETMSESDWAFFRIRPLNSPYRRVVLAAAFAEKYFSHNDFGFDAEFFHDGPAMDAGSNPFWESRTSYAQRLDTTHALLGDERRQAIWLNVVLPARLAKLDVTDRVHGLVGDRRQLIASLRKEWSSARSKASAKYIKFIEQELLEGESVNTVRLEQGALNLTRNFCFRSRCSECPIGERLMEKGWKADQ